MVQKSSTHTEFLKDYRPPSFFIPTCFMEITLSLHETRVKSQILLQRNKLGSGDLTLVGEGLTLLSISMDQRELSAEEYRYENGKLTLFQPPDVFSLTTVVTFSPQRNTGLMGLYASEEMLCTQCEPEGFRRITFFLDRPDVLSVFTVKLIADKSTFPILLSNGNRKEAGDLTDGQHYVIWQDPHPKPAYLFAVVAGKLEVVRDTYVTSKGEKIGIEFYVRQADTNKCAHAVASLKKAMRWDETEYGRFYDLEVYMIVAVSDFNMGAMENKGLNIFNTKYVLAHEETATDEDYENIEAVIGHEYFHNWSGNRVTCRDWFQLSLKEGLTVFRDQSFSMDMRQSKEKRIRQVQYLRAKQFGEDSGPFAHAVQPESYQQINNFYTVTIYEKGAELVRMLATLLGKEAFFKGMNTYFTRHDGQAVTIEDFVAALQTAYSGDLTPFLRWYKQAGTPSVTVHSQYDAANKTYTLTVSQETPPTPGQPIKTPVLFPLEIELFTKDGQCVRQEILKVEKAVETYTFSNIETKPIPGFLGDFTAPVKLMYEYTDEELAFLAIECTRSVTKWDALTTLYRRALFTSLPEEKVDHILNVIRSLLTNGYEDLSVLARMVMVPGLPNLIEGQKNIDIHHMAELRNRLITTLACNLTDLWAKQYQELSALEPNHPRGMQHRALAGVSLHYLVATKKALYWEWAEQSAALAPTMTEKMAALRALVEWAPQVAETALSRFYEQYKADSLVVDKWLLLSALISGEGALTTMAARLAHPAFKINNPNKVYALLSTFAYQNLPQFHAKNGEGYALIADKILEIDAMNPIVAARICGAFNSWQNFTEDAKNRMHKVLLRLSQASLSSDTRELVEKALV